MQEKRLRRRLLGGVSVIDSTLKKAITITAFLILIFHQKLPLYMQQVFGSILTLVVLIGVVYAVLAAWKSRK